MPIYDGAHSLNKYNAVSELWGRCGVLPSVDGSIFVSRQEAAWAIVLAAVPCPLLFIRGLRFIAVRSGSAAQSEEECQ